MSDEGFSGASPDVPEDGELRLELWREALAKVDGDEAAARILYIQLRGAQAEAHDTALRRLLRVMNTRQRLDSAAPSILLWAIVSSMLTVAFVVLGVVRRDFRLATVTAAVAVALWWVYLHATHRTR